MLMALGFAPIKAATIALLANTAPVAFGALATPIVTLAAVTSGVQPDNPDLTVDTLGAMVGRQPFGGNRLSGTGTKAGGPGYLLQFVEPRVVTENTMRHGLVV